MKKLIPYFQYLKPVLPQFALGLIFGVVFAVASGFGIPFMIDRVFPAIFAEDATRLTNWQIIGWASLIPGVMAIRGLSGFCNAYLISWCGLRVLESLRLDIFRKFQKLPVAFLDKAASGDLISRCQTDTAVAQEALTGVANDLVRAPLQLVGAMGFLAWLSIRNHEVGFLLVSLSVIPLAVYPIIKIGRRILRRSRQTQAKIGDITAFLSQNLRGAKEVRAYNMEESQTKVFEVLIQKALRLQLKIVKYSKGLPPVIEIISAFAVAFAFVYSYHRSIPFTVFFPLIAALYMSYEPLKKIGTAQNMWQRGRGALERLEEVLAEPVAILDPPDPVPVKRLRGEIVFSNVHFSYDGGIPVLSGIDLSLPAGTVQALVGPSGAGKSTFANLIPRFYEVTSGSLSIDGTDVRQMRQSDLRRNVALVSQTPFLFNETVLANILAGRPDASRAEVVEAAKHAFAHEFIEKLPKDYDTEIGEDAFSLSGGQKQRLAVARAFLKDAPILILDEATSALDSESEEKIKEALALLMRNKTVIMIAHRFGTILHADRILLFEGGRITATGTHGELFRQNPLYRSLYEKQTAGHDATPQG